MAITAEWDTRAGWRAILDKDARLMLAIVASQVEQRQQSAKTE